jgi:hypothetical protein
VVRDAQSASVHVDEAGILKLANCIAHEPGRHAVLDQLRLRGDQFSVLKARVIHVLEEKEVEHATSVYAERSPSRAGQHVTRDPAPWLAFRRPVDLA